MRRLGCLLLLGGAVLVLSGCPNGPCPLPPVTASFNASPGGQLGLPALVVFDASGSSGGGREIVSYEWDFGGGNKAYGPVVRHKFERPDGAPREVTFKVTLTVVRKLLPGDPGTCRLLGTQTQELSYGVTKPMNVVEWEVKPWYYGTRIEGLVEVSKPNVRVAYGEVRAYFYKGPDHELVHSERCSGIVDLRPEEKRRFFVTTQLRQWQFDWVELRTEAHEAPL